jgi:hypothetical protein
MLVFAFYIRKREIVEYMPVVGGFMVKGSEVFPWKP